VTVILAGAGNFWRSLRAADDLAIDLFRQRCAGAGAVGTTFPIQASGPDFDPQR
jgi:hypothetical protein